MGNADFAYYRDMYRGVLGETDFARLSRRSAAYLDQVTFGRPAAVTCGSVLEKVKDACCAVADELYRQERGGEVVSANNDGYTETYAASGKTPGQRLYAAAAFYLGNTGLLYRGV